MELGLRRSGSGCWLSGEHSLGQELRGSARAAQKKPTGIN